MESKFINRYHTFCRSLENLEKSRTADLKADFVLEATVLNFNLTIVNEYFVLFEKLRENVKKYYC